ncbi:glycosyltransferase [Alisedimentitalea sp. MJ-SS2]|uniref:glycosyltransferase n=1 Tax=Aliisedimentitalea sp. MJ-SS2 TaxID=3049795 RepID=UPI0029088B39|nr:glycosyltransferase [Alisedimentitalea sp. MJ-SS2]MDU8928755.1 glycosyltransferase [Alisedimentitalea sp. MJ-SS2]
MKVILVTRFSFFGKSGWKSSASRDPGELFAPERLDPRFEMFEKITLQSLADQTHGDFEHLVISSTFMPEQYQARLTEMCNDYLPTQARVIFRPQKYVGKVLDYYTRENYADQDWIAQSVLDDDDAVSVDFVEACRFEAETVLGTPYANDPISFISFPRGFTLGLRDGDEEPWLSQRYVPWTNLGLTIVKPPAHKKNLFNLSHLKAGIRFGSRLAGANRPFYLRTVHDHNDSRARHGDRMLDAAEIEQQFKYFPLLRSYFGGRAGKGLATAAE